MKIQIAGGLFLSTNYKKLLIPVAKTLILTGNCLIPDRPTNDTFIDYLETYWSHVIYIPGDSEMKMPGNIMNGRISSIIVNAHKYKYTLNPQHTIFGTSYASWLDPKLLDSEKEWLSKEISKTLEKHIFATYSPFPNEILEYINCIHIQGDQPKNQTDLVKGPITNHYRSPDGSLRSNYIPDFTIQLH